MKSDRHNKKWTLLCSCFIFDDLNQSEWDVVSKCFVRKVILSKTKQLRLLSQTVKQVNKSTVRSGNKNYCEVLIQKEPNRFLQILQWVREVCIVSSVSEQLLVIGGNLHASRVSCCFSWCFLWLKFLYLSFIMSHLDTHVFTTWD